MNIEPPYIQDGKPILRPSVVVYADILGYTSMIQSSSDWEDENRKMNEIFNILHNRFTWIADPSGVKWSLKAFSDNFILSHPFYKGGEFDLNHTLYDISHFQRDLANQGLFLRGAVSIGEMHVSDDLIWGKPLLEAYHAECKLAVYPCIILAESTMQYIESHTKLDPNLIQGVIAQDNRGVDFVNYLHPLRPMGRMTSDRYNRLLHHKKVVEHRLRIYAKFEKIFFKYFWIATYHNSFCQLVWPKNEELIIRVFYESPK